MKKPPFQQLKGTPAQKTRHRLCLGFTLGAFAVSLVVGCLTSKFRSLPDVDYGEGKILKQVIQQKGYMSVLEREINKPSKEIKEPL